MLKAIAIDNEKTALTQLEKMAAANGGIDILAKFTDPVEGLETLKKLQPHLVFLDIDMPVISGIYLAEQVVKFCPVTGIVFVTSFDDYALKAFELNALDYLLKPLTEKRFDQCIEKILTYGYKTISPANISSLNQQFKESAKKLFVDNRDETLLLKPEEIYYFEVSDKTVLIKTLQNTYTSGNSLDYFEAKLQNSNFYRSHRSYLVNLDKVSRLITYSKTNCEVGFADIKETVLVSKRNISLLKRLLEY